MLLFQSLVVGGFLVSVSRCHNREILKRNGDYFLRLKNKDGNLVMDEEDVPMKRTLKAPMYIRKKRIAHARDFQKFLNVSELIDISSTSIYVENLLVELQNKSIPEKYDIFHKSYKFLSILHIFLIRSKINTSSLMMSMLMILTRWMLMSRLWTGKICTQLLLSSLVSHDHNEGAYCLQNNIIMLDIVRYSEHARLQQFDSSRS